MPSLRLDLPFVGQQFWMPLLNGARPCLAAWNFGLVFLLVAIGQPGMLCTRLWLVRTVCQRYAVRNFRR